MTSRGGQALHLPFVLMMVVNTLLYPYSRFVYESVVNFIMGENVFFVNAILLLAVKIASMLFCWLCAIFVAPVGLAYLYYHHSKPQI
jgi:F0F1-type ATP synthase assembly protein I